MRTLRHDPCAGFTLLEITITVAILGFVIIIVYGVFARTLAGKEYAEQRANEIGAVRGVLARMVRDLEGTVTGTPNEPPPTPPPGSPPQSLTPAGALFRGPNHTDAGLPFDEIAFSAFVRRPGPLGVSATDLATVRYFAAADPANPKRRALMREAVLSLSGQAFDPEVPNRPATVMLFDGIAGIEFRFFDGRDWVEEWDSTNPRNFVLFPHAVEISVAIWNAQGQIETFRTAVDIPIARTNPILPQLGVMPNPLGPPESEPLRSSP